MIYRNKILIAVLVIALLSGAGLWFWRSQAIEKIFPEFNPTPPSPSNIYTNTEYGFSFQHSGGFTVSEFAETQGDIILLEKSAKENFQIYITPFDEEGPLTPERIGQDLPELTIAGLREIEVNSVKMLIFFSEDSSLGQTREVWFVWPPSPYPHGNYLYQVTRPAAFDEGRSKIVAPF